MSFVVAGRAVDRVCERGSLAQSGMGCQCTVNKRAVVADLQHENGTGRELINHRLEEVRDFA